MLMNPDAPVVEVAEPVEALLLFEADGSEFRAILSFPHREAADVYLQAHQIERGERVGTFIREPDTDPQEWRFLGWVRVP